MGLMFRRGPKLYRRRITLEQLEERIVLDAAGCATSQENPDQQSSENSQGANPQGAQGAEQAAHPGEAQQSTGNSAPAAEGTLVFQQDLKVVLISNALDKVESIAQAATPDAKVIVFDAETDNLASVAIKLESLAASTGQRIGTVAVVAHAQPGTVQIGADEITFFDLASHRPTLESLGQSLSENAQIQFYGCNLTGNLFGQALVDRIAMYTSADVFASEDTTGGEWRDWDLEYASNSGASIEAVLESSRITMVNTSLAAHLVADINPGLGSSNPSQMTVINGGVMFSATDSGGMTGLYGADLTGAHKITAPANYVEGWAQMANVNGTLFFASAVDPYGFELWKSDGTTDGTVMVKDINPGLGDSLFPGASEARLMVNINGTLYFAANDGANGIELWKSDGTDTGTVMVKDINPTGDGIPDWSQLLNVNGTLYLIATDGANGYELWKSDGSGGGTQMVADINPGGGSGIIEMSGSGYGTQFAALGSTLVFSADDGGGDLDLWAADISGAQKLGDFSGQPNYLSPMNGDVFFVADGTWDIDGDGVPDNVGAELWKTDGTSAGTVLVIDIFPGSETSNPFNLTNVNGTLFFAAADANHGTELWKSDGAETGTAMVKDINVGPLPSMDPSGYDFIEVTDTLAFLADDGIHGKRLWQSNGTEAGTIMSLDVSGDGMALGICWIHVNPLYFVYDDGVSGRELWVWTPDAVGIGAALFSGDASEGRAPLPECGVDLTSLDGPFSTTWFVGFSEDGHHAMSKSWFSAFVDSAAGDLFSRMPLDWLFALQQADRFHDSGFSHAGEEPLMGCGLYGYAELVQEGRVVVFNMEDIRISSLLEHFQMEDESGGTRVAALDVPMDDADWLRMVMECRGKCTGSQGLIEKLLQSSPAVVWQSEKAQSLKAEAM